MTGAGKEVTYFGKVIGKMTFTRVFAKENRFV